MGKQQSKRDPDLGKKYEDTMLTLKMVMQRRSAEKKHVKCGRKRHGI